MRIKFLFTYFRYYLYFYIQTTRTIGHVLQDTSTKLGLKSLYHFVHYFVNSHSDVYRSLLQTIGGASNLNASTGVVDLRIVNILTGYVNLITNIYVENTLLPYKRADN